MVGRTAVVYDYSVAQANSHWTMVSPDGRQYKPAYDGAVWIDKESRRVLRIEQRATAFPRDFTISRAECKLQYAWVKIEQKTYLLPSSSENIGCMSGSGACTRNASGVQELPEVHDGKQYHVWKVVRVGDNGIRRSPKKVMAPSWVLGACTQRVAVGGDSPPGCCLC